MNKFSNTAKVNNIDDEEIEEDIQYEGKFEDVENEELDQDNDDFIESVSMIFIILLL